jgi:hypothetical protein
MTWETRKEPQPLASICLEGLTMPENSARSFQRVEQRLECSPVTVTERRRNFRNVRMLFNNDSAYTRRQMAESEISEISKFYSVPAKPASLRKLESYSTTSQLTA